MVPAILAASVLVAVCLMLHYEALRLISQTMPRLGFLPPRPRMLAAMTAIMAAHTVEIWMFAGGFWLSEHWLGLGGFEGQVVLLKDFTEYVYYSAVSYTSLGLGDIYPTGGLRLVTGAEALVGLLMIAWSASFAYLMMVELWPLHRRRGPRHRDNRTGARGMTVLPRRHSLPLPDLIRRNPHSWFAPGRAI